MHNTATCRDAAVPSYSINPSCVRRRFRSRGSLGMEKYGQTLAYFILSHCLQARETRAAGPAQSGGSSNWRASYSPGFQTVPTHRSRPGRIPTEAAPTPQFFFFFYGSGQHGAAFPKRRQLRALRRRLSFYITNITVKNWKLFNFY